MKEKQFKKRGAILSCIQSTCSHPSAEMVHQMLQENHPDISLATVYRNLTLFKNQGLIQSLGTVDGIERFDGCTHPHAHFICTGCGRVDDLKDLRLPQSLTEAAEGCCGGSVEAFQLSFTGHCRDCRSL